MSSNELPIKYYIDYAATEILGYKNYPTDSVELGGVWHMDKKRTPFGPTISAEDFRPDRNPYQTLEVAMASKLPVRISFIDYSEIRLFCRDLLKCCVNYHKELKAKGKI